MTELAIAQTWFSFPQIDPIAFSLGPFAIRWYALSYMVGLFGGRQILRHLAKAPNSPVTPVQIDSLINYILFGVIIGGRLGYVIFYKPLTYLADPASIIRIWEGGMSFHGGFLGVVLGVILFARLHKIALMPLADRVALVSPLGLLSGRIANFINGELYGRVTSHPAGMVFPAGGDAPRHPSQLYEAGLEGLLLGLVLIAAWRLGLARRHSGIIVALFLTGYGLARFIVEFAREPDSHLGLYEIGALSVSQGQLLSVPMIAVGLIYGALIFKQTRISSNRQGRTHDPLS